ncbi:MAG: Histidine-tRNA ligase [Candidatus Woesebacteria bacterium GW2011_GWA1_45_8]|uniref:Histidine--tRNA ligase n=1 Tax=Candidatus Woesebacteria bacterium GW2011_GWA1_45_8 TaxID=1618559 RepID=A0A0G1Q374_9BACT|nr:MAG: Histidine-tRNA ligase [Candidatus Woesebacteria bacterium GW2011_GWA1_45_8]
MKKGPQTPKGFRDIAPELAKKRKGAIGKIVQVLEEFGFVPLETPTLEFADTLKGKYGEEEKLIYEFTDRGGRKLALRYDLTVPFARFIANNLSVLSPTFARYQIGQVFRGENPQKGRFREFTQLDFDIVGSTTPDEDSRVIAAAVASARKLGLTQAKMAINDRTNFEGLSQDMVRAIDKIGKIGKEGAKKELSNKGYGEDKIRFLDQLENIKPTQNLESIFGLLTLKYTLQKDEDFYFDPTLARGLDYYTGSIFELKPEGKPEELSIGGGGRYDNLIGIFAGKDIPAVGFSFGLDRLIELI